MKPITYGSDQQREYSEALWRADTPEKLQALVAEYRQIAADAFDKVQAWTDRDFIDFRACLAKERRGEFSGDANMERFGDVIMPRVMFTVSMTAEQFKVPWGLAYIRFCDVGRIIERDGIAHIVGPTGVELT